LTGWQRVNVTNSEHPYMKSRWVPGCTIGYEHTFTNGFANFLASLEDGPAFRPTMRDAMRTQRVCDAILESAKSGQSVDIQG
jgi:predicted dehydrogenase